MNSVIIIIIMDFICIARFKMSDKSQGASQKTKQKQRKKFTEKKKKKEQMDYKRWLKASRNR